MNTHAHNAYIYRRRRAVSQRNASSTVAATP